MKNIIKILIVTSSAFILSACSSVVDSDSDFKPHTEIQIELLEKYGPSAINNWSVEDQKVWKEQEEIRDQSYEVISK